MTTSWRVLLVAGLVLLPACNPGSNQEDEASPGSVESTPTTVSGSGNGAGAPATSGDSRSEAACAAPVPPAVTPSVRGLTALDMASPSKGFAVGNDVILVTDDGRNWVQRYAGPAPFIAVAAGDADHAWAATQHELLATENGGRDWRPRSVPVEVIVQSVHFADEQAGWLIGSGHLFRTTDGGRSWTAADPPCGADAVCFTGPDTGWAAKGWDVFRSTDGGRNWSAAFTLAVPPDPQFNPETAYVDQLDCSRPGIAWVSFSGRSAGTTRTPYVVYRGTADGQWTPVLRAAGEGPPAVDAPAGGSYPAPMSAVDAGAVVAAYRPRATPSLALVTVSPQGATAGAPSPIPSLYSARSMDFLSPETGWVLGPTAGPSENVDAIIATHDGGRTWQEQLAWPVQPVG